jgi:hypothetical protein
VRNAERLLGTHRVIRTVLPLVLVTFFAFRRYCNLPTCVELLKAMSNITCYGYDGAPYPNNFLCPNSDACCGSVSSCTSQRLCLATNGELIRPTCLNTPYTVDTCAQLCLYGTSNAARLPSSKRHLERE